MKVVILMKKFWYRQVEIIITEIVAFYVAQAHDQSSLPIWLLVGLFVVQFIFFYFYEKYKINKAKSKS